MDNKEATFAIIKYGSLVKMYNMYMAGDIPEPTQIELEMLANYMAVTVEYLKTVRSNHSQ